MLFSHKSKFNLTKKKLYLINMNYLKKEIWNKIKLNFYKRFNNF